MLLASYFLAAFARRGSFSQSRYADYEFVLAELQQKNETIREVPRIGTQFQDMLCQYFPGNFLINGFSK